MRLEDLSDTVSGAGVCVLQLVCVVQSSWFTIIDWQVQKIPQNTKLLREAGFGTNREIKQGSKEMERALRPTWGLIAQ